MPQAATCWKELLHTCPKLSCPALPFPATGDRRLAAKGWARQDWRSTRATNLKQEDFREAKGAFSGSSQEHEELGSGEAEGLEIKVPTSAG